MNLIETAYASAEAGEAVAGHAVNGNEGVLASLGLNTQLFFIQLFNFALIALIVWFFILKPLSKKLEERKKTIDDSLDKAKEIDTNYQMSKQKYQEVLDSAKVDANAVISKSYQEAEALGQKMQSEAKEEIEQLVSQAKKKIQAEKEKMREEIKSEMADLVASAVEKVIGDKLSAAQDKKIIEDALAGLKK